jgi:S-DNA-T family DNA segregation ATPase FtsK/SpoIIIE
VAFFLSLAGQRSSLEYCGVNFGILAENRYPSRLRRLSLFYGEPLKQPPPSPPAADEPEVPAETPEIREAKPKAPRKPTARPRERPLKIQANSKKTAKESLDFKKIARDERTWKIIGTVSLLISIFLFIAFISYFFTWKEDQDKVLQNTAGFLVDDELKVSNLLGRLGAWTAHFFIYRGFGVSSLLFCTFFFCSGYQPAF